MVAVGRRAICGFKREDMRRTSTAIGLVILLGPASGMSAVEWSFSDWDEDGNLELTEQEFVGGASDAGIYDDWDADNDDYRR